MGLPGHRRTSSDKRRRASHFALKAKNVIVDTQSGQQHLSHKAAPGATMYRGHAIHVKGKDKKIEKILKKSNKTKKEE